jgi:hypothetical protein
LEDELWWIQDKELPLLNEKARALRHKAKEATRSAFKPSKIWKAPITAWKWHKTMGALGKTLEEIRAVERREYHIKRMLGHRDAWYYVGDGWYQGPDGRATQSAPTVPTVAPPP